MSAPPSIRAYPAAESFVPPSVGTPREHGDPCSMILLGGAGDLAQRKLIPAIYHLEKNRLLHHHFFMVGVDREPLAEEAYRALVVRALRQSHEIGTLDDEVWARLKDRIFYLSGDLTSPTTYQAIAERLRRMEQGVSKLAVNRLFYLSVPPFLFEPIVRNLSESELCPRVESPKEHPWRRLIIEKPFGHSLETAKQLNSLVLSLFSEHQVYRIDHYLGKETVQNMLVFRSANAMFEPVWNRQYISHVQITAAETVGVETRGGYYESAGVVRDMFQNHLLQLVALTAMELPNSMSANDVRDEKVKVLRAVRPLLTPDAINAVRGQYLAGTIEGRPVRAYREEPNVSPQSITPTYAALRFSIDNGRWKGVPFYVRSGKRMGARVTEIAITFRVPPYLMSGVVGMAGKSQSVPPNVLIFRVQPNDGITLRFEAKVPGAACALTSDIEVTSVDMDFTYSDAFGTLTSPAYDTLLLDAMIGDATLFTRSDEVEVGWHITDPLLAAWESTQTAEIPTYSAGSWGPAAADELLAADGAMWRLL